MSGQTELRVETGSGVVLAGTLTVPEQVRRSPAVVAVHGASEGTRAAPLLQHLQALLPAHGIATLLFDRRGEGASTGSPLDAGFEDFAADVAQWIGVLREHPSIDATRIGLWSVSQGGWIAPLAAADNPALAFLVAVSPCGVTPATQMTYATATLLREAGYPEPVVARVANVRERLDEYYRGRTSLAEAQALVDGVRGQPWFALAYLPDPAKSNRWRLQMDFDVVPALRRLRLPVLLIFGEHDRWIPIEASVEIWRSALGPKADLTVASIPRTGHNPTLAHDPQDLSERGPISPDYERVLTSWLRQHVGHPRRHVE